MNYFELFDWPVSFNIDMGKLAQKYFELQKKYHPDFFIRGTEQEQEDALEMTTQLNSALKIFKNKSETIKYVLALKGLLPEDEKYQLPQNFLMEMMALNEDLPDDAAGRINALTSELYSQVQPLIDNYNDLSATTADLLKLKEYYYKEKYLQRILDRLEG